MAISVFAIFLFVASSLPVFKGLFGEIGILGCLPLALYFLTGALGKEDFNGFLWNVVLLSMGGSVLGEVVRMGRLLDLIGLYQGFAEMPLWKAMLMLNLVVVLVTSVISHTVGASVLIPVTHTLFKGASDGSNHNHMIVPMIYSVCFMTSAGMGMPISGFPNMSASAQEDAKGRRFISAMDFIKTGIIASLFFYLIICGVVLVANCKAGFFPTVPNPGTA